MNQESDDKKATMKMIEEQAEIYRKRSSNIKTGHQKKVKEKESRSSIEVKNGSGGCGWFFGLIGAVLFILLYHRACGWVDRNIL